MKFEDENLSGAVNICEYFFFEYSIVLLNRKGVGRPKYPNIVGTILYYMFKRSQ